MSLAKKITLGIGFYLVFMVALLPANVVLWLVKLPNQVQVSNVSGSIWSGSVGSANVYGRQLEHITWQIDPWSLLLAKLNIDLRIGSKANAFSGKAQAELSLSGVEINKLTIDATNGFLIGNTQLPFGTKVGGEVNLFIEHFVYGKPFCQQLNGTMYAHHLKVNNQFGFYPIGDVKLGLECQQGNIVISMLEKDNKMGISGQVLVSENNQFALKAKIKPTATQPEDMRNNLSILGQPDPQGYYQINYQGRIPGL
ncbi:MAG: type II secretion system protein N [Parashewanella sp.]